MRKLLSLLSENDQVILKRAVVGDERQSGAIVGQIAILMVFGVHAYWLASNDEDAYISFRYGRNLLEGHGLVFNPGGERVEGITNLLWTLLLAAASRLTGLQLPTLALVLGCACGTLTLAVAYRWCKVELESLGLSQVKTSYGALVAPALLAIAPGFALYAGSGLETPLFALLVTGGLYAVSRAESGHRCAVGGALLGAAALTRPDGALALAFGLAACTLCGRGSRASRVAAYAVPGFGALAGITLWRLWYYGSPVPNTFFAKAGGVEVMERWGWPYLTEATYTNWFQVAFLLALGGAVLNRAFLVRNSTTLAFAFAWCVYVVYVGGDYMPGSRFLAPVLPALYVLAVSGFALLDEALRGRVSFSKKARLVILLTLGSALTAGFVLQASDQMELEASRKANNARLVEYRRSVAEWLQAQEPDGLVAANAVGALGYYSDLRILDMMGLNDAHIARYGNKDARVVPGHQAGDGEYVLAREPDYIIPLNLKPEYQWRHVEPYYIGDRELADLPGFREDYRLRIVKLEEGRSVSIFERRAPAD